MNNLQPLYSETNLLSDQLRIDLIKARLAIIGDNPYFEVKIKPLTDNEIKTINPDLPKSHLDFLQKIGTLYVVGFGWNLIHTYIPTPWEESHGPGGESLGYSKIKAEPNTYICVACGVQGEYYGYNTTTKPFEFFETDFSEFNPVKCDQDSFLDVVEANLDYHLDDINKLSSI